MSIRATSDWDPRDHSILSSQRDAYDTMRETCPVARSEFLGWSLFRHRDVDNVLADPKTFSNASRYRAVPNGMDPPEHTRYRQAINPFFSREQVAWFEAHARRLANGAVEAAKAQARLEFASEFSGPLCSKMLCAFLGWPEDTWIPILEWTHGNQAVALSRNRERGATLARDLAEIVLAQVRIRREGQPGTRQDLTTQLMEITMDGKVMTDEELVSTLRNWTAGHGTVAAGLEILMFHLAGNRELQAHLRGKPHLISAAVDEILRLDGPLVANGRTAIADVKIGDRRIYAGDRLTLMWISANRDPRTFANPEEIRLDRDQSRNLLFGAGIHDCVGAPLARLELTIALDVLLAQTTSITLTGSPPKRSLYPSNGFAELYVSLE